MKRSEIFFYTKQTQFGLEHALLEFARLSDLTTYLQAQNRWCPLLPTLKHARGHAGFRPDPLAPVDASQRGRVEHSLRWATAGRGRGVGRFTLPVRGGIPVVAPEALCHLRGIALRLSVGIVPDASLCQGDQQQSEESEDDWREKTGLDLRHSKTWSATYISFCSREDSATLFGKTFFVNDTFPAAGGVIYI